MAPTNLDLAEHLAATAVQYDLRARTGDPMMARLAETYYDRAITFCTALLRDAPRDAPPAYANNFRAHLLYYVERRRFLLASLRARGFPCADALFNNVSGKRARLVSHICRSERRAAEGALLRQQEDEVGVDVNADSENTDLEVDAETQADMQLKAELKAEMDVRSAPQVLMHEETKKADAAVAAAVAADVNAEKDHADGELAADVNDSKRLPRACRIESKLGDNVQYDARPPIVYVRVSKHAQEAGAKAAVVDATGSSSEEEEWRSALGCMAEESANGKAAAEGVVMQCTAAAATIAATAAALTATQEEALAGAETPEVIAEAMAETTMENGRCEARKRRRAMVQAKAGEISPIHSSVEGAGSMASPDEVSRRAAVNSGVF